MSSTMYFLPLISNIKGSEKVQDTRSLQKPHKPYMLLCYIMICTSHFVLNCDVTTCKNRTIPDINLHLYIHVLIFINHNLLKRNIITIVGYFHCNPQKKHVMLITNEHYTDIKSKVGD